MKTKHYNYLKTINLDSYDPVKMKVALQPLQFHVMVLQHLAKFSYCLAFKHHIEPK